MGALTFHNQKQSQHHNLIDANPDNYSDTDAFTKAEVLLPN